MKKKLLVLLFASISLASISSFATTVPEKGFITLNTTASTEVAPDTVEISFAIKTSDTKSMQKATTANKEISDKIYTILKSMLTTSNGDWIKTSDFNASPVYSYSGNKKNFDKYEVSNRIIIHTKTLDKVGTMIDKAIESGATNVDSLKFSVSNYESQCNSLIEIASKKASTRASIAAKSTGSFIDGVKSMNISCSEQNNYSMPRFYMAKNTVGAVADGIEAETPSTSISGGAIKINANVSASFYIK